MTQAPQWLTPAGNVGTFQQGKVATFTLETIGATDFTIIAGDANQTGYFSYVVNTGTSITDVTSIVVKGAPFFFNQTITSEFVVRASNQYGVNDRTFTLTVEGPVDPLWVTPSDYLQVGPNLEPYALNKNRVDYKLQASFVGSPKNLTLRYYIGDQDGRLPPGLTLNENNGLISGYVNDSLILDRLSSSSGGYDNEFYDAYPFDHVITISTGNIPGRLTSVSKIYQFWVTVTDGISSSRRKFKIRVEDPNTFRADTTQITGDTTNYLSGIGYLIPPIWLDNDSSLLPNPSNLGTLRANNNQVIDLNVYDPYPFVGPISFDWDSIKVNPEIRVLSSSETNVVGIPTANIVGFDYIIVSRAIGTPLVGMHLQLNTYVENANNNVYQITKVESYGTGYRLTLDQPLLYSIPDLTTLYLGSLSSHPPGLTLDSEQGILYGRLPYQPAYSKNYRFTIRITKTDQETGSTVSTNHIFNLTLKGDIESTIQFVSSTDLGILKPGYVSDLTVKAVHTAANLDVTYSITGGSLPPGLTLTPSGNISGTIPQNVQVNFDVKQYGFGTTTFDNGTTTFNRTYTFNVTARDSYLLSAISKDFVITIEENTLTPYTSLYVRPLLAKDKRLYFRSLVEDSTIFDPSLIYKIDDTNFGIQRQIRLTIEHGLERINLDNYIPALANYFKRRRYFFGEIKSATAVDSSGTALYDVVYSDIIDSQMLGNSISVSESFTQTVNGSVVTYYPDSVTNEKTALRAIEVKAGQLISVDDGLRPKFMTTLQADTGIPLGFIKACILCYTLPGESSKIISNIARSGFDLKNIDFDVDRISVEDAVRIKTSLIRSDVGDTQITLNDVSGIYVGTRVANSLGGIADGTVVTNVDINNTQVTISKPITKQFLANTEFVFLAGTQHLVFGAAGTGGGGGADSGFYIICDDDTGDLVGQELLTEDGINLSL